jgi:hypothetical protein
MVCHKRTPTHRRAARSSSESSTPLEPATADRLEARARLETAPPRTYTAPELADAEAGLDWWNGCGPAARLYWLNQADSACRSDVWAAYQRCGGELAHVLGELEAISAAITGTKGVLS